MKKRSLHPKFEIGDHVRIARKMPSMLRHFNHDCNAVVDHHSDNDSSWNYSLLLTSGPEKGCRCAWYPESLLTLIKRGSPSELRELRAKHGYED